MRWERRRYRTAAARRTSRRSCCTRRSSASRSRITTSQSGSTGSNQRYLMARVNVVRARPLRHAKDAAGAEGSAEERPKEAPAAMTAPAALDVLCTRFGLSEFERDVLLLCAGVELDSRFAA